jgi:hypothetical protein
VLPGGCTTNAIDPVPSDCASSRGGTFNNDLSTSWDNQGIFGINGVSYGFEANLGYEFDAQYGLDTLGLGYADGADSPVLKNQTIAAYAMASPLYTYVLQLSWLLNSLANIWKWYIWFRDTACYLPDFRKYLRAFLFQNS